MRVSDFRFELPDELIARTPAPRRTASRLLVSSPGQGTMHRAFPDLANFLRAGDLLVFNDTRVMPARLFGSKAGTGGAVEILIERLLEPGRVLAMLRASKPPREGSVIVLQDAQGQAFVQVEVTGRVGEFFELRFPPGVGAVDVMQSIGHMPLPPYIDRPDAEEDRERYQTVYARSPGAVAAPTAGLHFDEDMLRRLRASGVETAFLTLHVGAGTFQPVRCDAVEDHRMHAEYFEVGPELCDRVNRAHAEGRRVVAVGTTSLRALESASTEKGIAPFSGETQIFIYPGYRFRCVDALLTNFHLPESTLLMLVCAFAGRERMLQAYRAAVVERYRFFSYGDAMFVEGDQIPAIKAGGVC